MYNRRKPEIIIWYGDITKLDVDAVVNSANSSLHGMKNFQIVK